MIMRVCSSNHGRSFDRRDVWVGLNHRPIDYRRAVVINAEVKPVSQTSAPRSERRSSHKNSLTGPTLLEMSGNATTRPLRGIFSCLVLKRMRGRGTSTERTRNSVPSRLEGTHPMCAYLHRLGDYERSKVMSLVNLVPLIRSLRRPRTDPRATGGGDAQTVHSVARRVSG
jgi:hypothetical protein